MKLNQEQINRLLTIVTLSALTAMAGILAYVESSYRGEIDAETENAVRAFVKAGALKTPTEQDTDLGAVQRLAESFEGSGHIRRLFVEKRAQIDGRPDQILLHPYSYALENSDWRGTLRGLPRGEVARDNEVVGALYFDLDLGALWWVRFSIGLAVVLILLALGALTARIFSQERVLTATTEILEQNQRELIRMERLSLAGLLTANIFHDIRKPITNIKHELDDLAEALGGFAGATRPLRNMRDQVGLFFDILRELNLERFVRSDEADEEYVDINRVLEQALRLVQYERGATQLNVTLNSNLPLVLARPYRLVQVFSNLILNAYQALEGRGELTVETTALSPESADFDSVRIEIIDTGPGIAKEDIDQVFSAFYSTKPSDKGTGLGLYISRTIVEGIGGSLQVESEQNEGTRFTIILPASD